jgi:hypothetical protein
MSSAARRGVTTVPLVRLTTSTRTAAAAALLVLALGVTGCGDDESDGGSGSGGSGGSGEDDPVETQAEAILACADGQGLPGQLTRTSDGVRAVDLTTSDQTIVLHVHASEEDAEAYDGDTLDFAVVDNVVVLGGAISPENRAIIDDCIAES